MLAVAATYGALSLFQVVVEGANASSGSYSWRGSDLAGISGA